LPRSSKRAHLRAVEAVADADRIGQFDVEVL
jgi:hypothetical protein